MELSGFVLFLYSNPFLFLVPTVDAIYIAITVLYIFSFSFAIIYYFKLSNYISSVCIFLYLMAK